VKGGKSPWQCHVLSQREGGCRVTESEKILYWVSEKDILELAGRQLGPGDPSCAWAQEGQNGQNTLKQGPSSPTRFLSQSLAEEQPLWFWNSHSVWVPPIHANLCTEPRASQVLRHLLRARTRHHASGDRGKTLSLWKFETRQASQAGWRFTRGPQWGSSQYRRHLWVRYVLNIW